MTERILRIVGGALCDGLRRALVRFLRPELDKEYQHWLRESDV
jgi:hypothetical protein